jgi:hypothetical protein
MAGTSNVADGTPRAISHFHTPAGRQAQAGDAVPRRDKDGGMTRPERVFVF